jgi:glycosyltransferase involved in cell wall biosynthesis
MNMPAVSVIVPNYNHSAYLPDRLNSILQQTFTDFEVIILDDCSTDDSRQVIEGYADNPRIKHIVYNESNSGSTFRQWYKGIELARGEWIWLAESDDWCEPVFLETLMRGVSDKTAVAIAQSIVVADSGKVLWNSKAAYLKQTRTGLEYLAENMLKENSIFNASMCIFRRSFFYNIGPEFTTYKFCGDWVFWINMLLHGDIFISGKVLNYFRKHGQDVSSNAYRSGLYYKEYFKLIEYIRTRGIIDHQRVQKLMFEKYIVFLKDKAIDPAARGSIKKMFYQKLGNRMIRAAMQFAMFRFKQRGKALLLPDIN